MKITVIGAGNIGTQFAAAFAAKGNEVTVFASKPEKISNILTIVDDKDNVTAEGNVAFVTADIEKAVNNAEYIFVTYPAFMLKDIADKMYDFVNQGTKIGVIPGTGGAEFAFKRLIEEKGIILFGLQRVPAVARLKEYGKTVCVSGYRDRLKLAGIPKSSLRGIGDLLTETFSIPCDILPNYLSVTMTPSNPILHTTRLRTEFADYKEGVVYPQNILFYEEWADESSKLLFACDEELQKVCQKLTMLDLTDVRSLKEHYESDTEEKLTAKIRSIKSLQGLGSPMKEVEGGFVPDFSSRYFTADFPYGLSILEQLAHLAGVEVPNMTNTINWYKEVSGDKTEFKLTDFGINTIEDLYKFYCR